VAIPSDFQIVNEQERYTAEAVPVNTLARIISAVPVIVAALGQQLDVGALLDGIDGVMVPGGLSNVHPSYYGGAATSRKGPFDEKRDATTLPLIRAALERGIPLLLTCRGFQELNVALGGTLKQEPDNLPEDKKHGTPVSARTEDERFKIRHAIDLVPDGNLAAILRTDRIRVNSLHSQLVDQLAPGLVVEATAEDGSVEAATVSGAKAFALGVIFHPEYWAERDAPSLAILNAFADAVRGYASRRVRSMHREAAIG
jgi:putative glutamine amidotransferase